MSLEGSKLGENIANKSEIRILKQKKLYHGQVLIIWKLNLG
jgi:hypothetical protein